MKNYRLPRVPWYLIWLSTLMTCGALLALEVSFGWFMLAFVVNALFATFTDPAPRDWDGDDPRNDVVTCDCPRHAASLRKDPDRPDDAF